MSEADQRDNDRNRTGLPPWAIGPFYRPEGINPVLKPDKALRFQCPREKQNVAWAELSVCNSSAVVKDGKVVLLFRAEDKSGPEKVGAHVSRVGLASGTDGFHFKKRMEPVLNPGEDEQNLREPRGCEDPRVVLRDDGVYVMTYTQGRGWFEKEKKWGGHLGVALSRDLVQWQKTGPAFANNDGLEICDRAGSIVCREDGEQYVAVKIKGSYWMYWHDGYSGITFAAKSDDLISWIPVRDPEGNLIPVLRPRKLYFDSQATEPGPQAFLKSEGILLLYNGVNSHCPEEGDSSLPTLAYTPGQALLDSNDPMVVLARLDRPFLIPTEPFEKIGQCANQAIFIEGLVRYKGKYFLYYGGADQVLAVAVSGA